jgi:hypothetical protein
MAARTVVVAVGSLWTLRSLLDPLTGTTESTLRRFAAACHRSVGAACKAISIAVDVPGLRVDGITFIGLAVAVVVLSVADFRATVGRLTVGLTAVCLLRWGVESGPVTVLVVPSALTTSVTATVATLSSRVRSSRPTIRRRAARRDIGVPGSLGVISPIGLARFVLRGL